jgi:hypothetical protein
MADQPVVTLHPAKALLLALAGTAALMLPLSAGLLGSSPVAKIAVHIATALAAREMESPVVAPAMAVPDIRVTRHDRHRTAAARTPPAQTETSIMVRTPAIQINTVLDTHLPAIPAPVMAATVSEDGPEDALVCRKPERLANSRFTGPEVCLHASQWARLPNRMGRLRRRNPVCHCQLIGPPGARRSSQVASAG